MSSILTIGAICATSSCLASTSPAEARLALHNDRFFGVSAAVRGGRYFVTTLSRNDAPGATAPAATSTVIPPESSAVIAEHGGWSLELLDIAPALVSPNNVEQTPIPPVVGSARWINQTTNVQAVFDAFADTALRIFPSTDRHPPALSLRVHFVADDAPFRFLIEENAEHEIRINLVQPVASGKDLSAKDAKRTVIEALAAGLHEYLHVLVNTSDIVPFNNLVSEETAASVIEYVAGFVTAGCSASGSISLDSGNPIRVPVVLAEYDRMLRPYREVPALEGYARALLNIANAFPGATFDAAVPGTREKLISIARAAAATRIDYRRKLLPPLTGADVESNTAMTKCSTE